jgi:NAD(P)-dependent dehydrogenase (short-subunit alcohol dehydrogenase family)
MKAVPQDLGGHAAIVTGGSQNIGEAIAGRLAAVDDVAAFLCSPLASFVSGSLSMVDGGWVAYGGW